MIREEDLADVCESKSYRTSSTDDVDDNAFVFRDKHTNGNYQQSTKHLFSPSIPILVLHIDIGGEKKLVEKLEVFRGDDPENVASQFCIDHGIKSQRARAKITSSIIKSLENAVAYVGSQTSKIISPEVNKLKGEISPTQQVLEGEKVDSHVFVISNKRDDQMMSHHDRNAKSMRKARHNHENTNLEVKVPEDSGSVTTGSPQEAMHQNKKTQSTTLSDLQREEMYNKLIRNFKQPNKLSRQNHSKVDKTRAIKYHEPTRKRPIPLKMEHQKLKTQTTKTKEKRRQNNKTFERLHSQAKERMLKFEQKREEIALKAAKRCASPRKHVKKEFAHLAGHLHGTLSSPRLKHETCNPVKTAERLYIQASLSKARLKRIQDRQAELEVAKELKECTFQPKISQMSQSLRRPMEAWAAPRDRDRDEDLYKLMRMQREKEEVQQCTFQPEISERSKQLARLSQSGLIPLRRSVVRHRYDESSNRDQVDQQREKEYASYVRVVSQRSPVVGLNIGWDALDTTECCDNTTDMRELSRNPNHERNITPFDPYWFFYASRHEYRDGRESN